MNKNKMKKVYESDASQLKGNVGDFFIPESINEIKSLVRTCEKIVPRGGGTGLAGGCVPGGDIVIDLSKLNKIGNFEKQRKTVEVEAGVILDDLQDFLENSGLEFPVKPSSHSVCTIGGMIACDAVGSRAIRYGKTSKWISWIDVVNSEGEIERKGATELSDYAGMEGITGVIVKACLKLEEKKERTGMLIAFDNTDAMITRVKDLKRNANVSMIEFINAEISGWLGLDKKMHLIVEFESDDGNLKGEEYDKLMNLRDRMYPLLSEKGYSHIEDPKILSNKFKGFLAWLKAKGVPVFGHISVGIFHPCFSNEQEKYIPEMMKLVKKSGGQVSGEHGIGILKKQYVEPNDKKILNNIKKRTDKNGKFNMGKII